MRIQRWLRPGGGPAGGAPLSPTELQAGKGEEEAGGRHAGGAMGHLPHCGRACWHHCSWPQVGVLRPWPPQAHACGARGLARRAAGLPPTCKAAVGSAQCGMEGHIGLQDVSAWPCTWAQGARGPPWSPQAVSRPTERLMCRPAPAKQHPAWMPGRVPRTGLHLLSPGGSPICAARSAAISNTLRSTKPRRAHTASSRGPSSSRAVARAMSSAHRAGAHVTGAQDG